MKKRFAVSMLALATLTLVGCGGTTGETTGGTTGGTNETTKPTETTPAGKKDTIVIGSPTTQHKFVTTQVNKFLKDNNLDTKYEIKMYDLPEGNTGDVKDWTASGAPDVYAFASDKIGSLKSLGAIAPVPSVFVDQMTEDFNETSISAGTIGDSMYAYPFSGDNGYFLYYNKDLIDESKIGTVEDIIANCKATNTKFAYGMDKGSSFFSIGAFMSFGARYTVNLNEDGSFESASSNFNSPEGIKAAKAVFNILHDSNTITDASARDAVPSEANGISAIVEGGWKYDAYKEALGDKLGLAKLPTVTVEGETKNLSSFLGYKLYGVNDKKCAGNTERLSVLHQIANYLVSEQVQKARWEELNVIPTNKTIAATDSVQNSPLAQAIFAQSEFAVAQTTVPNGLWDAGDIAAASLKAATADNVNYADIMSAFDAAVAASESL